MLASQWLEHGVSCVLLRETISGDEKINLIVRIGDGGLTAIAKAHVRYSN
jgi:hypothetical protein